MALQLDPRWRLLWRDPFTVQFGSSPGSLILHEIGQAEEKLLRALQLGFAPSALGLVSAEIGLGLERAEELLQLLAPVLRGPALLDQAAVDTARAEAVPLDAARLEAAVTAPRFSVAVEGPGAGQESPAAARLAYEVRALGWTGGPARLAVLLGAHALAPERVIRWQAGAVPQLPVLFDDAGVVIGPVLSAEGPCLRCLELHRLDADACWPALATQLLGQAAHSESGLLLLETVAVVCRILAEHRAGEARLLPAGQALRIEQDGRRSLLSRHRHERCGCLVLAELDRRRLDRSAQPELVQEA